MNGDGEMRVALKEVQRFKYAGCNMLKDPLSIVDPKAYAIIQSVCFQLILKY